MQNTDTAIEAKQDASIAMFDYGDDAGQGFDGQDNNDITIPFLTVLQSNSPQVDDGNGAAGQFYNTVTEEALDEVTLVPALTRREFVEFVPRESGGGFKGIHAPNSPVVKAAMDSCTEYGKYNTPDGNQLIETFTVFWQQLDEQDNPIGMLTMGFTSMKIKVYKKWNTRVRSFQVPGPNGKRVAPPLFAHKVKATTVKQENSKGKFYNIVLSPAKNNSIKDSLLPPTSAAFQAARDLGELVRTGMASAGHVADDANDDETPF